MNAWLRRHKSLAMAVGILLVVVILVFSAVIPIYQNVGMLTSKIKVKSKELEGLTTKVSILSKLDANVLAERVQVLDNAIPPKKDILMYLATIQGLSQELGLTFGGLSLSPGELSEASGSATKKVTTPKLQRLETELKMSGGHDSVYTFLKTIEGVLPLMEINDIKVSVLSEDQFALTLTLSMLWAEPATIDVKGPVTLFGADEEKYFSQLAGYRRFKPITSSIPVSEGGKADLFAPFMVEPINLDPTTQSTTSETEVIPQQ
ncbi:MAG: hypothetical protein ABII21_03610 [bacterium]